MLGKCPVFKEGLHETYDCMWELIPCVVSNKTSPWELMDPQRKNNPDKTRDIRMPYVGNGYV